jgi:hypothetical protein
MAASHMRLLYNLNTISDWIVDPSKETGEKGAGSIESEKAHAPWILAHSNKL